MYSNAKQQTSVVLDISTLLSARRKEQGLTRTQVAAALQLAGVDISREVYKFMELGRRTPKAVELLVLARVLDIDLNAIRDDL